MFERFSEFARNKEKEKIVKRLQVQARVKKDNWYIRKEEMGKRNKKEIGGKRRDDAIQHEKSPLDKRNKEEENSDILLDYTIRENEIE